MRQVGADIVKRALPYSLKLIANNAGDNGSVVMQRVLESDNPNFGYNAATGGCWLGVAGWSARAGDAPWAHLLVNQPISEFTNQPNTRCPLLLQATTRT